ncbi:MAG: hypothetical protein J07HR59_01127 [Halorubrum sp. J07HR59]|nr:MAG: hypothetical protein J07HR59_01127 [Halorubrum sp. J07HR59]
MQEDGNEEEEEEKEKMKPEACRVRIQNFKRGAGIAWFCRLGESGPGIVAQGGKLSARGST